MVYPRLKEHFENEVKCDRLHILVLAPSIVFLVFGLVILMTSLLQIWLGIVFIILGLAGTALAGRCMLEARDYRYAQEDYIIVKILDVISEEIASDEFKIVSGIDGVYNVGFHNVKVDYETLQAKVDEELRIMNKIAHKDFRVKLL